MITDKVGGSSAKPEVSKQSKEKRLKHKVSGYKSESKRRSIAGCRLLLRTLEGNANDCMETRLSKAPRQQKQKVFFLNFLLCSCSKIVVTFLCCFGFPNSKFYGYLHHRALKTSLLRATVRTNRTKVLILRQELKNQFLSFFVHK